MASEGQRRANPSTRHSECPERAGSKEMAEDVSCDRVTDLELCEALMLKGALMHRLHVPYLAAALIFALKIMSSLPVSELQLW